MKHPNMAHCDVIEAWVERDEVFVRFDPGDGRASVTLRRRMNPATRRQATQDEINYVLSVKDLLEQAEAEAAS